MLATLVDEPVAGEQWLFERKLDGVRVVAVRDGRDVTLWSRNGKDRTSTYPEIADALLAQRCHQFVVDTEVVAFQGKTTSFSRLQQRSGLRDADQVRASSVAVYAYLFDLLYVHGEDVSDLPLRRRKVLLEDAFDFSDPLRFTRHRNARGPELLEDACARGWEGLIAKRADSAYRAGRSKDWLKLKCVSRQEFVIGGYTEPQGSRTGFGALLVGYVDDHGGLTYAGKVGTGYDTATLEQLAGRLQRRERPTSPFDDLPNARNTHWVAPELVCEIGFTEWTSDHRLRHPRYLGLRDDKDPADVVRERPTVTSS